MITAGSDVPPANPAAGEGWIVGDAPVGDWAGNARAIAGWTDGGWRFVAPRAGMRVWSAADGCDLRFVDGGWIAGELRAARILVAGVQVVTGQQPAIDAPNGGATVDIEARAAIAALLDTLRSHGLIAA